MRDIEELVRNIKKYSKVIIQKKLKSKKNTVAYVTISSKPRILKWFIPGLQKNLQREYEVLKNSQKQLQVPFVFEIDKKNNILILNYITGDNLCDLLNDKNIIFSEKERLVNLLAQWYITFHNHFKKENEFKIHGDATLRNFIFNSCIFFFLLVH